MKHAWIMPLLAVLCGVAVAAGADLNTVEKEGMTFFEWVIAIVVGIAALAWINNRVQRGPKQ